MIFLKKNWKRSSLSLSWLSCALKKKIYYTINSSIILSFFILFSFIHILKLKLIPILQLNSLFVSLSVYNFWKKKKKKTIRVLCIKLKRLYKYYNYFYSMEYTVTEYGKNWGVEKGGRGRNSRNTACWFL